MEVKEGRIMPTNNREEGIISRLLREQETACFRDPSGASVARKGQQLSDIDSYKVFCAIERAIKVPESRKNATYPERHKATSQEEKKVFSKVLTGLALNHIENARSQIDNFSLEEAVNSGRIDDITLMAATALRNRYQD